MDEPVSADSPLNIDASDPDWRAFEKHVANISARINSSPAQVLYDARLPARHSDIKRQIDVYIQGDVNGIPVTIAIECKKYSRPIDVGEIDAFIGKLHDLAVDKGVFYVHDGVTPAARKRAQGAAHPRVELREFAAREFDETDLDDIIDLDCPNDNCYWGVVSWVDYRQPAGGAAVSAGYCGGCGTFAVRCRDCEEINAAEIGEHHCWSCGATYDVDSSDYQSTEPDSVVQLTAGAE